MGKAANCLSAMCKACYATVTTAELSGPEYTRVENELVPDLTEKITTRQITYLLKEHSPIPIVMVNIQDPQNPLKHKYVKKYSTQVPVRYLMPKLHKSIPAFRGITACCGTTTEGVAKIVNAVLVGIRPVLDDLWREECIRIGLVANKCWITSGGAEIVNVTWYTIHLINWWISFHICQILSPSKKSCIVSAHRLPNITLLTLIAAL